MSQTRNRQLLELTKTKEVVEWKPNPKLVRRHNRSRVAGRYVTLEHEVRRGPHPQDESDTGTSRLGRRRKDQAGRGRAQALDEGEHILCGRDIWGGQRPETFLAVSR